MPATSTALRCLAGGVTCPRRVVAFDYRGRGLSAYDPDVRNYAVPVEAADVLAGLDSLGIECAHFVGTSRGGLIAMVLAALRLEAIRSVVLNDIGPVVELEGLQRIRAYLARSDRPASFSEAAALQRTIHGEAFWALSGPDWERFASALYRQGENGLVLDFDPKLIDTVAAPDPAAPLPTLWPQFERLAGVPVMVIRGENSRLLSAATVAEMTRRHPGLRAITVTGQGHAPLLDTGDLPARIAAFLDGAEAA